MTLIETAPGGPTKSSLSIHHGNAEQAHADRVRRLREAGREHTAGPGWIEMTRHVNGAWLGSEYEPGFEMRERVEYTDEPEDGAR